MSQMIHHNRYVAEHETLKSGYIKAQREIARLTLKDESWCVEFEECLGEIKFLKRELHGMWVMLDDGLYKVRDLEKELEQARGIVLNLFFL